MTVLPLDFHENLAWKVSDEDVQRARLLATRRPSPRSLHMKRARKQKPKCFRVGVIHVNCQGDRQYVFLAKFPCVSYNEDHEHLLRDDDVLRRLDHELATLGLNPGSILAVIVRQGAVEVAVIEL